MRYIRALIIPWSLASILLGGCTHLSLEGIEKTPSTALAHQERTALGRLFRTPVARHAGKSGFILLDTGEESLLWRGALIHAAQRTIDAQYFIWKNDNIGTLAAEGLLSAARRGTRVRVLIDALTLNADQRHLSLLDNHPNIQIRLYNPISTSNSLISKLSSALSNFKRLNQRMHNKAFVVDNSVAIVGGRNIADEYYDMNPIYNFRDRDVLTVGPIVRDISHGFDSYWNSQWAVPIHALHKYRYTGTERQQFYDKLHTHASKPANFPPRFKRKLANMREKLSSLPNDLFWGKVVLVNDEPGKNTAPSSLNAFGKSGQILTEVVMTAQHEIIVQTPYLIMLPGTFEVISALRAKGVHIRLHTNSLDTTDSIPAFSGYARQRERIVGMGVKLHEQRLDPKSRERLIKRHRLLDDHTPFTLHAKTAVIDRQIVFIGSFNLDPRSSHLNTEMGILIYDHKFANHVANAIMRDMHPHNSWQLVLSPDGELSWIGSRNGKEVRLDHEPSTKPIRAIKLFFFSLLPLNRIL